MLKDETFESLYREQLGDLYDAEQQMVKNLPVLADAASSQELKAAFEVHLAQTKEQVARLESIFAEMPEPPLHNNCRGMRELLAEGALRISEYGGSSVLDAALIAAAQDVESYEISRYATARRLAVMLNHERAALLLQKTLKEERDTAGYLGDMSEAVIMGETLEDAGEALEDAELAS